ncbi:MAG: phenylalanine--tRNA ligase subunit beta [Oscillospiraceae bacterium]|nr:phenylalanine--tRNA ligase subunit beta [Oscillospiraceae bacterium]
MLLSRKWLDEYVTVDAENREFAEDMTLSGSKVEGYSVLSDEIKNVVVGRVLSLERHPDSDHMWICQVDVGGRTEQIVTGAQNVRAGDLVPVALDGSTLPGGVHINAGVLRGVASNGMLCSLKELGLTVNDFPYAIENGIFILQEDCAPGDDICPVIGCDDTVVEFEITPNRPDCLSVIGLAREAAVTYGKQPVFHDPVVKGSGGNIRDHLSVEVRDAELCPRYTARMIKNIHIAPSPKWLRQRLRASGVRPINNIVDITNYVMLEYGQPMHAFDYACLDGGRIIVRRAAEGEVMNTLDSSERVLTPDMLVIADENKPVGLAGVMGGENSEITDSTTYAVFECANFNGTSIRRTAARLGMRTDASARYEKGLDVQATEKAVSRACELVEQLGAGEVIDGVIDVVAAPWQPTVVKLEPDKVNALLGTDIPEAEMRRILTELGFELKGDDIIVPSWRGDIEHYSDIAEEVARFYGYNNIPVTLMRGDTTLGGYSDEQLAEREIGRLCRDSGYSEIITYSFISPSYYDKIRLPGDSPLRNSLKILNPLGEDTSIMRTTILPSMLEILTRNYNYRNLSARLYEIGKVYYPREDGLADEPKMISLGAYGNGVDFYAVKGTVETVLSNMRVNGAVYEACTDDPSWHPGRCARVYAGGRLLGTLGQIHPKVADNYGVDCELYAAVLSLDAVLAARAPEPKFTPLPKYPSVSRDIAVVCDEEITVARLESCIRGAGGAILRDVALFDIYRGLPIAPGKKSCAFSLTLRSDEKTLTDAESDAEVGAVLNALADQLGAVIR